MNIIPFIMLAILILIVILIGQEIANSNQGPKYVIRDGRYVFPDEQPAEQKPDQDSIDVDTSGCIYDPSSVNSSHRLTSADSVESNAPRRDIGNWYSAWRDNGFTHAEIAHEFPNLDLSENKNRYENDPNAGY